MTRRQEIVNRVVTQLKQISTSNTYTMYGVTKNYLTNFGTNVFTWRAVPFQDGEKALVVRDLDEPKQVSQARGQGVLRQLHMQVEIVTNSETELREVIADVEAAIGEGRESVWADITSETRPRLDRSLIEETPQSQRVAGAVVEFYIDYPTLAFMSVI